MAGSIGTRSKADDRQRHMYMKAMEITYIYAVQRIAVFFESMKVDDDVMENSSWNIPDRTPGFTFSSTRAPCVSSRSLSKVGISYSFADNTFVSVGSNLVERTFTN